jgi:diguanylate cyclase (GGDEF)-like protein/PAS domain S-box-containing protein
MRKRLWYLYPIAAGLSTLAYLTVFHHSWLYNIIGISSPIVILLAVRLHQPEQRAPWYLFALGQTLFIGGDVIAYNYDTFFGTTLPYPAISDALYLSVYPCLVAGILMMIRRRNPGRDRASFIDSLMVSIGLGTISWVFLIAPYAHDTESNLLTRLTSISYPIMDLLLIAVAVRLAVGAGKRAPSFLLMMVAVMALFATDAIYGWLLLGNGYVPGSGALEIGWIAFYVIFGMAALHPSMRVLSERAPDFDTKLTRPRLILLAGAALMAPGVQAIEAIRGEAVDLPIVIGAAMLLFLLAIVRMAGLVHSQEQSANRERALRAAGAALVTATNREGIYASTLTAAHSLAGEDAAVRICEVQEDPDTLEVVASLGGASGIEGTQFAFSQLDEWKRQRLLERRTYSVAAAQATVRGLLGLESEQGVVFTAPLYIRDAFHGLIVVAVPSGHIRAITDGLEALASQVSLAVESAALTEEILLSQSEKRFASLVQNASDVVTVIEPDTTVRYASPASSRVLGYAPEELEGTRFANLISPEDKTRVLSFLTTVGEDGHTGVIEFRAHHKDGHWVFVETLRTSLLHDPNVKGIVLNTRDITERKEFEEQLSHQAFHDSVTNLPNRALFRDRVTHAIERQQRDHKPVAVLFMDLDDFKTINDSLGHAAGDQLLNEVGERLKSALRAADTAARLGGDEFAILLEDGGEGIQAVDVADRIMESLEAPFPLEGKEVFVRASIGIAVAEDDENASHGEDAVEEILRNADVAMYMAKENGKGRYQVFEPAMHETALKRLELKADLQRAVEHGEFVLHYQPVIELESGRISGVEALIRWMHPERGMVPPLDFIPLAEQTGLIVTIGRWVLREACLYARDLQARFPSTPPFHMAVNLSARQLQRPEIVDEVREILEETGLEPSSLILEITESVMMSNMELSIERLGELKALGVLLAVDDFGTGYSSLNYIQQFPVDILKVDKSFIDVVNSDARKSALTATILKLAQDLDLKPVAEGIERADQLERLLELHCDLGQGYFFAKPLDREALQGLLDERQSMQAEADALAHGV